MQFIRVITLGVLLLLVGCESKKVRQPSPLPKIQQQVNLHKAWSRDVGAGTWDRYLRLAPALYADIIYTADRHGKVKAIDSKSGKVIWQKNYRRLFTSDMGVSSEYLMLGTADARLLLINRTSGNVVWEVELTNEVISMPIYHQGVVVVKTADGVVTAINAQNKQLLWTYQEEMPALVMRTGSAPIVKGNKVFVGFASGRMVALSLRDGTPVWKKLITSNINHVLDDMMVDVDVDPKGYHSEIYVAGVNSNLVSIDSSSYSVSWQKKISTYSGLDVDRASVVVSDNDGVVYSYRRSNGRLLWRQESLRYRGLTAPVIYKGMIFIADGTGYLHVLSHATGKLLGSIKVHVTGMVTAPILHKDKVYVKSNNGYLTAFSIRK